MDGETRPALLATDDADTAAVRLFTSRGWQRLGLLSDGVQVMGLRPRCGPRSAPVGPAAPAIGSCVARPPSH